MTVSVVICCHDAAGRIHHLLRSLALQDPPLTDARILCVDNASSDNTAGAVAACESWFAPGVLKVVTEPRPGKCHALNTGVNAATGRIVAFADDDVNLSARWFSALVTAFDDPGVHAVGGRILPAWDGPVPSWVTPAVLRFTPIHDLGARPVDYDPWTALPVGANWAVRKSALTAVGLFDPWLGRQPGGYFGSEESDRALALIEAGGRIRYVPDMTAFHPMTRGAATRRHLVNRAYVQGIGAACFLRKRHPTRRSLVAHNLGQARAGQIGREQAPGRTAFFRVLKAAFLGGYAHGLALGPRLVPGRRLPAKGAP